MQIRAVVFLGLAMALGSLVREAHGSTERQGVAPCRRVRIAGEVKAGEAFTQDIGNGLNVYLQPIASGWILRVVPLSGLANEPDYAELATPPYNSVTPLSISTDFSFRAQDAIGWNPRRFRFATDSLTYERLLRSYRLLEASGSRPSANLVRELARLAGQGAGGSFKALDSRLVAGTADQAAMAAAVATHFTSTAHTVVPPANGRSDALGKILWMRFEVDLELPPSFHVNASPVVQPGPCTGDQ